MDITECDNYVLDVNKTLISNIPFFMYVLLIGVFVIKCAGFLGTLESQEVRLLGAVIYMFSVVRLMSWSVGMPNLEYKPR